MFYNIVIQHGVFVVYLCTYVLIYIDWVKNHNNPLTCLVDWAGTTGQRQRQI